MGMLYRVSAWLLGLLPVDDAGRRVFDETLADWRREGRTFSGVLAVVRSVLLVSWRDFVSAPMGTMALRIVAWSVLWVVLGLVVGRYVWGDQGRGLDVVSYAPIAVVATAFFLPAAVLLSAVRLRTRVPALGLSLTLALLAVALMGWAVPAANRILWPAVLNPEVMLTRAVPATVPTGPRAAVQQVWPSIPVAYYSTNSVPELVRLIDRGPYWGWGGIRQLSFQVSFVALYVLVPFLAAVLRTWQRPARYVGFTAVLVALLYQARIEAFIAPDWILWMFVSSWVPVMMLAVLVAIGSRSADHRSSPTPTNSPPVGR